MRGRARRQLRVPLPPRPHLSSSSPFPAPSQRTNSPVDDEKLGHTFQLTAAIRAGLRRRWRWAGRSWRAGRGSRRVEREEKLMREELARRVLAQKRRSRRGRKEAEEKDSRRVVRRGAAWRVLLEGEGRKECRREGRVRNKRQEWGEPDRASAGRTTGVEGRAS